MSGAIPVFAKRRPDVRFLAAHPAHWLALGFGAGLSAKAPGTVGTLWAWLAFLAIDPWLGDAQWAVLLAASLAVGTWACTLAARHLGQSDPSSVVWDEVLAFWLILWLIGPSGFWGQLVAFGLFRYFDAAKPGPVRWADSLWKGVPGRPVGWVQGFGIVFDDLVAALCTLLVIALWRHMY